jgi:hypothetical protein
MGGVYEICHQDGLWCHGIHAKFHKDSFKHSKVQRGIHIQTANLGQKAKISFE